MSEKQVLITVVIFAVSVWITRFLPFLIFRDSTKLPAVIEYLGRVLPAAMMGLLVVYCFKDYNFADFSSIIPAAAAVATVVGIHLFRHNTILSISVGTAAYMILIRIL